MPRLTFGKFTVEGDTGELLQVMRALNHQFVSETPTKALRAGRPALARKVCLACKEEYIPRRRNQQLCGKTVCRKAYSKQLRKDWWNKNKDKVKAKYHADKALKGQGNGAAPNSSIVDFLNTP